MWVVLRVPCYQSAMYRNLGRKLCGMHDTPLRCMTSLAKGKKGQTNLEELARHVFQCTCLRPHLLLCKNSPQIVLPLQRFGHVWLRGCPHKCFSSTRANQHRSSHHLCVVYKLVVWTDDCVGWNFSRERRRIRFDWWIVGDWANIIRIECHGRLALQDNGMLNRIWVVIRKPCDLLD